jgi:TPR repeat protein
MIIRVNALRELITSKYLTLDDGIQADADTIYNAKRDDGEALYDIGFEYHNPGRDYSKALAWYQLAENQNYSPAYNNIGALYDGGFGEPRRIDIALGYYLKAAAEYDNDVALGNIGILLLYGGGGVPLDKYKALEWLAKSGEWHERVKALNHQGIHLKLQDTSKLYYY